MFSTRGTVDGATYTDVKAQLPALNFLMIISVAAALLFIVNIRRRGWVLPVIAVGLWGFISIVVGTIYPAYIQRFEVKPNEFTKEQPYISRNIAATRYAFGIDHIVTQKYNYKENLDSEDHPGEPGRRSTTRGSGIPISCKPNFQQNQEFRPYFTFSDLDLDRYPIGDQELEVEIAVRELNSSQVAELHVAEPAPRVHARLRRRGGRGATRSTADQSPDYLLSDIPPTGDRTRVDAAERVLRRRPQRLHRRRQQAGREPADREPGRLDHPLQGHRWRRQASSFLRKAAIALNFGSWDLFISHQVDSHSRVMFLRDVADRVQKAAPFLKLDADPYSVVDRRQARVGRSTAYTTTNRYPYSQSLHPDGLTGKSGLDSTFNYVRNSVKVTVDAYNGTITYYVIDNTDPIIRAYEKAFPKMFTSGSKVPAELRAHFRYPEDLFRAQTEQYQRYHLTGASEFYRAGNLWSVAPAPNGTDDGTGTPVDRGVERQQRRPQHAARDDRAAHRSALPDDAAARRSSGSRRNRSSCSNAASCPPRTRTC